MGIEAPARDTINSVLKWLLLIVGVCTFAGLIWAAKITYSTVPPQPEQFVSVSGNIVMTNDDIVAGKAGFQRADLMDYGSLYGMGSYFGEDYTAQYLHALGVAVENNIAQSRYFQGFDQLSPDDQNVVQREMQGMLQGVDLTQERAALPDPLADAIGTLRTDIAGKLLSGDPANGWTGARTLNSVSAAQTADFLIFSSLTTVARRPDGSASWTQNWPYEPLVGNTPTTSTFIWTWVSFMFTFFCFGLVIFVYEYFLNRRDTAPKEFALTEFRPLTESQRKVGKFFLAVAAVFLAQLGAGVLMAHDYADRVSFYGITINNFLPFNFLR
ncbi:MAG: nitric oxide reductase, partial [Patescibacteria group bacterium]|nr:nitric oxide reductase [Patescibacteria group bacterium]